MEFIEQKNGFELLKLATDSKLQHVILIFNHNKYHYHKSSARRHKIYWRCCKTGSTKCNKRLTTDAAVESIVFPSLIGYQQQLKQLIEQDIHKHPNTWSKQDKDRKWTLRKLYEITKISGDARKAYIEFNNCYPVIAAQTIPRFSSVKNKLYEARCKTQPKLPTNCKGKHVFFHDKH